MVLGFDEELVVRSAEALVGCADDVGVEDD